MTVVEELAAAASRADHEGYTLVDLVGPSMSPTLEPGDIVVVERASRIAVHDVVALQGVVHRVVWLDPFAGVWHMGDAAHAQVERALLKNVRGRVVAIQRGSNWVPLAPSPRSRAKELAVLLARMCAKLAGRGLTRDKSTH